MKRLIIGMTALGMVFSAGLWAHHAAEGIVSDEIWQSINDNLIAASSPHLENFVLVTDDTMGGATVWTDPDTGDMYLLTVSEVYITEDELNPPETEEEWDVYIEVFITEVVLPSLDDSSGIPSGTLNEDTSSVIIDWRYVDSTVPQDGIIDYAEILIYEPIGNGSSQMSAGTAPTAAATGARAKGG